MSSADLLGGAQVRCPAGARCSATGTVWLPVDCWIYCKVRP